MKKCVVVLLSLLIGVVGASSGGIDNQIQTVGEQQVRVQQGDTLWAFLSSINGRSLYDGHELVSLIRTMNNLEPTDHLRVGQIITIPKEVK